MRVALVSQSHPPSRNLGGISTHTRALARGLAEAGHEVHVLAHADVAAAGEHRDGALRVHRLEPPPGLARSEAGWMLAWSATVSGALADLHERVGLDVVEAPEWGGEAFHHLIDRPEGWGPPTVLHLHGPASLLVDRLGWPEPGSELERLAVHAEAACLRLADATCSCSRYTARWCAERHGLDLDDIPVLHAGVDLARFAPDEAARPTRPTVLFVGRVAESKGADVLGAAALQLVERVPDLLVRFAGSGADGALATRLVAQASAAGRPGLFEITGFVDHDALPERLNAAHVFAVPSPCEGGPSFAHLEAMACGLPAIACRGTGVEESVEDGVSGFLVEPGDAVALADRLERLLHDETRRAAVGRAARARVEAVGDRRRCLADSEAFLSRVAAAGRRDARPAR